ncbi:MAG: ABC transporter permease [Bacteroidia bacterium]
MGKIGLIIQREFLSRVRTRTYIVMCLIGPILFAAMLVVPAFVAGMPKAPRKIIVVDGAMRSDKCYPAVNHPVVFKDSLNFDFDLRYLAEDHEVIEKRYRDSADCSVLFILPNFMGACDTIEGSSPGLKAELYSKDEPGAITLTYLERQLTNVYRQGIYEADSVSYDVIEKAKKEATVANVVKGKVSKSEVKMMVGFGFGILIYIYILLFGNQVMRSVVEEKSTRIVEVIVSSVRPFQLMMGKIIGTAMAGILQFIIWMLVSLALVTALSGAINDKRTDYSELMSAKMNTAIPIQEESSSKVLDSFVTDETQNAMETILSIPWGNMLLAFVLYFLLGYLMYAAMFAAVGSAVDSDADTQQFSLPITIPLIITISMSSAIMLDPNGSLAKWMSQIPFSSPVAMLIRIPYGGVSPLELIGSLLILAVSFLGVTYLAAKIYRVGILMTGKKGSWKELGKWMFYKD